MPLLQTFGNASRRGFAPPSTSTATFELISTTSVSSNVSTVTFSSIPSNYKYLELRISMVAGAGGGSLAMQLNGDSGTNYSSHYLVGYAGSVTSYAGFNSSSMNIAFSNTGANTTFPGVVIVSLPDYASTSKFKTIKSLAGISGGSTSNSEIDLHSGMWRNTSAVSSITLTSGGGNYANGSRLSLYGIRG